MTNQWLLWLFEGITLGATVMVLFARSVFMAALNFLISVIGMGVIYGWYGAEFLFLAQIMVYGGGIAILILFVTMISMKGKSGTAISNKIYPPILIAFVGVVTIAVTFAAWAQPKGTPTIVATQQLSKGLLLDYALPLEVSGMLLLISLIGAAIVSIQKPTTE